MALTTDARADIAAALNAAGILAFASVPATVTMPSVVVIPSDPYAVIDRIGPKLRYRAEMVLACVAQALDNAAGLAAVESLIDATLAALPAGVTASRVSRPLLDDFGAQGTAYVSEIYVSAHLASEE